MKLKTTLLISFLLLATCSFAQKKEIKKLLNTFLYEHCEDCYNSYYDGNSKNISINSLEEHNVILNYEYDRRYVVTGSYWYKSYYGDRGDWKSSSFTAIIDYFGQNVQSITFKKDHLYKCKVSYGEKKRQEDRKRAEEEAKRYQQQQVKFYKNLVNDFCISNYSKMFSSRSFVSNSLVVESMTQENDYDVVYIKGKHQYKGRYGDLYKDMPFEATVEDTGRGYRITFKKRSKADFLHSKDYWETGTGSMPYSY